MNSRFETWSESPLYRLLFSRLTRFRSKQGLLDVPGFAASIGYSHETAYRWLRSGKIPATAARAVVKASRRKIALHELYQFVLS